MSETKTRPKAKRVSALDSLVSNGHVKKLIEKREKSRTAEPAAPGESVQVEAPAGLVERQPTRSKDIPSSSVTSKPAASTPIKVEVQTHSQSDSSEQVYALDPKTIRPWQHADRPTTEVTEIEELAEDIKHNGQSTPILVRRLAHEEGTYQYEYIFGCRRLAACQLLDTTIKAIIKDQHELSDAQAFSWMFGENEQRKNISTWARSLSFEKVLKNGVYKSKRELSLAIGKSESYIKKITVYSKIPSAITEAIGNMQNVSINTAEEIVSLAKEKHNIDKLIKQAEQIREGISAKSLRQKLRPKTRRNTTTKYSGHHGDYFSITHSDDGTLNIKILEPAKQLKGADNIAKALLDYLDSIESDS